MCESCGLFYPGNSVGSFKHKEFTTEGQFVAEVEAHLCGGCSTHVAQSYGILPTIQSEDDE
jgi:hypothetical protein